MTTTPPPGHPPAPAPDTTIRARAAVARLLARVAAAAESPAAADALLDDLAAVLVDMDKRPAAHAPSVPDLAEVALGALAAAGRGDGDGEVQRATGRPPTLTELADAMDLDADGLAGWLNERPADVKAEMAAEAAAASVAASRALPMLRLEDVAGDALEAATQDDPNCIARISYDVWDEFYGRHRASVGLDRAHATDLRDWLTRLLGDAPPATCGESSGSWREDEVCLLPAGHEGWHKALAATWTPGIPRAEWSAIAADEAASYTWVPTEAEQARIDATLAHAGPHNAGDSPAEVLAFADELDAERDAAAKVAP